MPIRRSRRPPASDATSARSRLRVSPAGLRWVLSPASLGFKTTADVEPLEGAHAQERALEALHMGADLYAPGYNVFCVGLLGTERLEAVRAAVVQIKTRCIPSPDRCYVMNFKTPDSPRLLELPRGTVRQFKRDVDDLSDQLVKHLGLVFEEDRFAGRIRDITEQHQRKERDLLGRLHDRARESGFAVSQAVDESGTTVDLAYRLDHVLVSVPDLEQAVKDAKAGLAPALADTAEENEALLPVLQALDMRRVTSAYRELSETLQRVTLEARRLATSLQKQVSAIERAEALVVVNGVVQELAARYSHLPAVVAHLEELKNDVLDHLVLFKKPARPVPGLALASTGPDPDSEEDVTLPPGWTDVHWRYRVNVVLDNRDREDCPLVVEANPTVRNLFGAVVRVLDRAGRHVADHRSVRPGSLLAADGGYLIVDAADLLAEPDAWRMLKRALVTRSLDLRDAGSDRSMPPGPLLKPDPIPLNVKVLLVGDETSYHYLDMVDQDFRQVFKIRAEFEWLMDRTTANVQALGRSLRRLVDREGGPHFTAGAVAAVAEHAARLAEQGGKMVSAFDLLADVARQAGFVAREARARAVGAEHVRQALAAAERRCSFEAELVREAVRERRIIINTTGRFAGQINGLAVRETLDLSFGYPVRITAVVGHGNAGVVNIEREARLSGNIHAKGMLIVEGFLQQRYGRVVPLAFSGSIAFEQSYGEIDGDSASCAEIYTLLSALSDSPLEQGIAVTGSVNQFGEIQPIGGVNEKIEGWFDACSGIAGGVESLDGTQGVAIPASNVGDLVLRPDVVQAARDGRFHVWGLSTVEEGLELLTGRRAGTLDGKGRYAKGTVHADVLDRLRALSRECPDRDHGAARGRRS